MTHLLKHFYGDYFENPKMFSNNLLIMIITHVVVRVTPRQFMNSFSGKID